MDAYSADKMTETDAQGRFRLGPLRPGTDDVQPDTERGFNINSRLKPAVVQVGNGRETTIGDLLFVEPAQPRYRPRGERESVGIPEAAS